MGWGELMDRRTDGRTDSPCVLQDFVPLGAAALLPFNLNHLLLKQGTGTAYHLLPLGCHYLLPFLSCQVSGEAAIPEATLIMEANPSAMERVVGTSSSAPLPVDDPRAKLKTEITKLFGEEEGGAVEAEGGGENTEEEAEPTTEEGDTQS